MLIKHINVNFDQTNLLMKFILIRGQICYVLIIEKSLTTHKCSNINV